MTPCVFYHWHILSIDAHQGESALLVLFVSLLPIIMKHEILMYSGLLLCIALSRYYRERLNFKAFSSCISNSVVSLLCHYSELQNTLIVGRWITRPCLMYLLAICIIAMYNIL